MHEPLQFDLVEVSGTNQYRVHPLLLVSTVALPTLWVASVDPEAAPEPPEPPEPEDELPHAAITSTAATAPAGTSQLFRMTCLRSDEFNVLLIPRSAGLVRSRMVHVGRRWGPRVNSGQLVSGGGSPSWLRRMVTACSTGLLACVRRRSSACSRASDGDDAAATVSFARAWLTQYRNRAIRSFAAGNEMPSSLRSNNRSVAAISRRSRWAAARRMRSSLRSRSNSVSSRLFPACATARYLAASAVCCAPTASPATAERDAAGLPRDAGLAGPALHPAASTAAVAAMAAAVAARRGRPDMAMTASYGRPPGGRHARLCSAISPGPGSIGWPGRYICGGLFPASCPPSMGITAPVMNEDWSEQSHSTACATSWAVPVLAIGVDIPASRWARGPAACRWWVKIGPGATTLTLMPWSA